MGFLTGLTRLRGLWIRVDADQVVSRDLVIRPYTNLAAGTIITDVVAVLVELGEDDLIVIENAEEGTTIMRCAAPTPTPSPTVPSPTPKPPTVTPTATATPTRRRRQSPVERPSGSRSSCTLSSTSSRGRVGGGLETPSCFPAGCLHALSYFLFLHQIIHTFDVVP